MAGLSDKRILLLEDEPLVALLAEDMLLDLGAVVIGPVATIESALAAIEANALDAAFLDINIGGALSFGVAERLCARGVPVVFASGYTAAIAVPGASELIQKPYQQRDVERALLRALGEAQDTA
ncbi:MAG TPA: response regulator [Vitreimonas sp.]|uniref:response regulator n=1 Tax=Vitreimonas sp. TaxID=3069702 RepID=UPI002D4BF55D|nr:response regulator [Vitreimonas sp.]HYD86033.1 response regulator [Vitreimonas sp.]